MRLSLRSTVPLVLILTVAACSTNGTSTMPTQPVQSEAQVKSGARCKALPLINAKTQGFNAKSRSDVANSSCGIRPSHKGASYASSSGIQVFDAPDAIQVNNCSPYDLFNDCGTFGQSINASGAITGYYLNDNDATFSYLRTPGGKYTTFQASQNQTTMAFDITDNGAIAGQYFDGYGVLHAFIRNKKGSFLQYEAPWASQNPNDSISQGTGAGALNAKGDSAGIYFDADGVPHGFIRHHKGSFDQVGPDGALTSTVCIVCLNNPGTIAGNYTGSDGVTRAYVRSTAGKYTTVAPQGAEVTLFSGVNNSNRLTGFYVDQYGVTWGLIVTAKMKQIAFQDPNASQTYGNGTQPEAIDDAGDVTGLYSDSQGIIHGFYRSISGKYAEFDPPGSVLTIPYSINSNGAVTGYWYDGYGATHGFIWQLHKR